MRRLAALATAAAFVVPASASGAGWSTPTTVFTGVAANPGALSAFGGGVGIGDFANPGVMVASRVGDTFGPARIVYTPVRGEFVWTTGSDGAGDSVVLTVRRHLPYQRVRAVLVSPTGVATAPRTISGVGHSAAGPMLAVAADGSAVAAWAWHDKPGWRVQAAIKPAGGTFGPAVTLSDPDATRPFIDTAAGRGGAAAVSWHFGGSDKHPDEPLHVASASAGGHFSTPTTFTDAGDFADVGLGVSDAGDVVVAFEPEYYLDHGGNGSARLIVATGSAGRPLSAAHQLGIGGRDFLDEVTPAVAFTADGDALIAWISPTPAGNGAANLSVFTRAAGQAAFGAPQVLSSATVNPAGATLAGGPGGRAVVAWFERPHGAKYPSLSIHAAVRGLGGGAFGPESQVNPAGEVGLWPSAALTPTGDAVLTWIHNRDGSGGGQVEASLLPAR